MSDLWEESPEEYYGMLGDDPDEPSSAVQQPNTDTLDEQIIDILKPLIRHTLIGDSFIFREQIKDYREFKQLKTLFTEHSKQARIDELKHSQHQFIDANYLEKRVAQLSKRNK